MLHMLASIVFCHRAMAVAVPKATLVKLPGGPGVCLDGSPGAYYYRPAQAERGNSSWVVALEGGGECVDEASCVGRAKTDLGSSKNYASSAFLYQFQAGEEEHNPDMFDWNMVYVKYCSGDLHSGTGKKSWGLTFAGHAILAGVLTHLKETKDLGGASQVVLTGYSAGGLGTFINLDFVASAVVPAVVVGAPVGGFYFSNNWTYAGLSPKPLPFTPWTFDAFEEYYSLWGSFVPANCAVARPNTPWQCLIALGSYST